MDNILKALSHPTRRKIVALLWDKSLKAGDIAAEFDVTHETISGHLKVLRDAKIIEFRRDHNIRWYSVCAETLRGLYQSLFAAGFNESWLPPGGRSKKQEEIETITNPHKKARKVFETAVDVKVSISALEAYKYFVEAELLEKWAGENIICNPVEGGRMSFSVNWGMRIEAEFIRLIPGALVMNRWRPADDRGLPLPIGENFWFALFRETGEGTLIEVRQYAYGRVASKFIDNAWRTYIVRLRDAVEKDAANPER